MTRLSKCRKLITCLAIALWVSGSAHPLKADIIRVPGGFSSIEQAVQHAAAGDTILLSPGTYTESNIDIRIPLTISSEWIISGAETFIDRTIIEANDTILFSIYSDDVEISGLTILNGDHTLNINGRVTIRYNHMENNLDPISMETAGGGYVGYNRLENNKDDGIDLDIGISGNDTGSDIIIEHNAIINSEDDGIEIRLFDTPNQNIHYTIRYNTIRGSLRAGIQLISYDVYTGKVFDIHHNIIRDCKAAIGCMGGSNTIEDLSGAPLMDEKVLLYNNTFLENEMGASGGNRMIAINNVVANHSIGGFKRFGNQSVIEYNLFFENNASDLIEIDGSAIKSENILDKDPMLDAITWIPMNNSPCIDAGRDKLVLDGITVIGIGTEEYADSAPEIGAMESEGESAFETFRLYQVSDLQRVFEDGYNLPVTGDTIHAFGIRGEVLSAQCVLVPNMDLTGVTVEVGELKDRNTGQVLPQEGITWNFVGSVSLSESAPNQPVTALSRPAPASYPEFLMDEPRIDISQGIYQPIWLTVQIPENVLAGLYAGEVQVKTNLGEGSLPMVIEVFPLVLPAERHLNIAEWYSTDGFAGFHGIEEECSEAWFTMLGKYAENLVAHRQNTFRVPMSSIQIRRTKSGNLEFDLSLFDRIARVFWNTGEMDYLETGFLTEFGEEAWFSTEIFIKDILVSDAGTGEEVEMKGEDVIPYLLPAFEIHLRQQDWLDKTLFHIKDEPSIHNALAWKKMSTYIHQYAPSIRRIDAIETFFLLDEIEIAVPKLDALASWYDSFSAWQQEGNELWFYTVGIYQASCLPNKTIDMPLIDSRIMHWLNYKYDAAGYLHWGWNRWNEDPFGDPGKHLGDGWHVYPAREGVLNSLRWEQMRNGIQDYEYLWMLEDRIDSLKTSLGPDFNWIDPSQRGKEIADAVVMNFAEHTGDPQVLYQAKREIIREILDFDTSPKIYVQTDPLVNTAMTDRSTVAVLGWTETGTRVTVNGKELPVREDGLFLEQFHLSPENSRITVQAVHPDGSKEIIREFVIGH